MTGAAIRSYWIGRITSGLSVLGMVGLGLSVAGCSGTGEAGEVSPQANALASAAEQPVPLDFEVYRQRVEPVFLRSRGGFAAPDAPCVACHAHQATTPLKLQVPMEEGGRVFWTEEQSRQNFEIVSRLVDPGDVENSRLLMAPLSPAVGGRRHTGGAIWESTDDPDWQLIAEWIGSATPDGVPSEPEVTLDFEFFRACVQPLFVNARENMANCTSCHSGEFAVPMGEGRDSWTEEESRYSFEQLSYLIEPGHPELSRFLHKPLHPRAGGDLMHNGPRRWTDQNDPERQALAAWIRGEATGSSCPAVLDF